MAVTHSEALSTRKRIVKAGGSFAALENANICSVCRTVEMFKADKFIKPLSAESDRG